MVSLRSVQRRFEIPLEVIAGGSGTFHGVLSEAEQNSQPTYVFAHPRKVLRVAPNCPIKLGMLVLTPTGERLLVGDNGPSETWRGALWRSFRMFAVTRQVTWTRRRFSIDPITQLRRDIGEEAMGTPWMSIEPMDRETNDSKLHHSFETVRFISGEEIQADDLLDGHPVTKCDVQLGLRVGVYTG